MVEEESFGWAWGYLFIAAAAGFGPDRGGGVDLTKYIA